MRSFYAVSLALFTGMLLLSFMPTTNVNGVSTRSAEAAPAVKVTVKCAASPEVTLVKNNTNRRIVVKRVGSIYQPRTNEPFRVRVKVRPGRSVTFKSGSGASGRVLTGQHIYKDKAHCSEKCRQRAAYLKRRA